MIEPLEPRIAPAVLLSAVQLANEAHFPSVMAIDSHGNIIVAGEFLKAIDVDTGTGTNLLSTSDPAGDVYIEKLSPAGKLLWATRWGGAGAEFVSAIAVDSNDNIFLTGSFASSNTTFNNILGLQTLSASGLDVFLLKLKSTDGSPDTAFNGSGQLQWGGTGSDQAFALTVDHAGAVAVVGAYQSTAGFGGATTITAAGGSDGFLFKVDGSSAVPVAGFGTGGMITAGGTGDDSFYGVLPDSTNNLFLSFALDTGSSTNTNVILTKVASATGATISNFGAAGTGNVALATPGPGNQLGPESIALDASGNVVSMGLQGTNFVFQRFDGTTGTLDTNFGSGGVSPFPSTVVSNLTELVIDKQNQIYAIGASGSSPGGAFVELDFKGLPLSVQTLNGVSFDSEALDAQGHLVLRGEYAGSVNLDPTGGKLVLPARSPALLGTGMSEGFVENLDPFGFSQSSPLVFLDLANNFVTAVLRGPGTGHYTFDSSHNLDTVTIFNTTLASSLTIQTQASPLHSDGPGHVAHVLTNDTNQSIGSVTIGNGIILGNGTAGDPTPSLHISGKVNKLTFGDIEQNATIKLGDGLPYNIPNDTTTPDTYNNHPDLTIRDVLGPGVEIDVLGDGTPGGVGGGGLGNVLIHSWKDPGFLRTTQSVGNFTIQTGNFFASIDLDSAHNGELTTANMGNMTLQNGSWGSTSTEVEGNIQSFSAMDFLAGATITAASIGVIKLTDPHGNGFQGNLILNDPNASAVGSFTVNSDFSGTVVSQQPLKKIKINGDFTGSLEAPGIGGITAYSFVADSPTGHISTGAGVLGVIKSTSGIIQNYQLTTTAAFGGISVNVKNLGANATGTETITGLDNVQITAASIGNISVKMSAAKTATDLTLIGIGNSSFVTSNTGTLKGSIGSIGNVSVALSANAGTVQAVGISHTTFDAQVLANEFGTNPASTVNPIGKISVLVKGAGGESTGLDHVTFEANSIGTSKIGVIPGMGGTATLVKTAGYIADTAIKGITLAGNSTSAAVTALSVLSGGVLGPVTISGTNGSLVDSSLLAGQALTFTGATDDKAALTRIRNASMGNVTVSGGIMNTTIAAGGNLGSVKAGANVDTSFFLAGSLLGADHSLDGVNDSFQRAASITSVTVKGAFTASSIDAGVDPVMGGFGDDDDALGALAGTLTLSSKIGTVSIGASATLIPNVAMPTAHTYVIEAASIQKLIVPQTPPDVSFAAAAIIDTNGNGEDVADILVRLR